MNGLFLSNTEIVDKIEKGRPVIIKDYKVNRETEEYAISVLGQFLQSIGKEKVFDHLSYCLRELINNAKKANTKRVFFQEENLDITKPEEYLSGMKLFKEKTLSNIDYYLELQEKKNLYVQVYYHIKDPFLNIIITNNSPIVEQEKERIISKITCAKTFNSIEDAFQTVLDDTEGAGLGIVIMILMLRKIGIYDKNFAIVQENNSTHVRLAIPLSLVTEEDVEELSDILLKEINTIPQFPEHIKTLTEMIESSNLDFRKITDLVRKDPGLTMDILKMANSAHYRRRNKIEKIELAVTIIGAKGLKYLIQSYGIRKVMEERYSLKNLELIWAHSYEVAKISSILCDTLNHTELGEQAYIGGLLHDIGKIVLSSLHQGTIEKITRFCMSKNISMNIVENMLEGANHFQIGAKMAEKWGLPPLLIEVIKNQSNPYGSNEEHKEITKIIYLANIISNRLDNNNVEYLNYESMILKDYHIDDEEKLKEFIGTMQARITN